MTNVLTPEQVHEWLARFRGWPQMKAVLDSHEVLRMQRDKAEQDMEDEFDDNIRLEHALAEAQVDVLALVSSLKILSPGCTPRVFGRPGIKRLMGITTDDPPGAGVPKTI